MIDISKYSSYFHDGGLIDIQYQNDEITLSIESSEMDLCELQDNIQLSEWSTIQGKLHLKGIKSIQIDGHPIHDQLKMKYDSGSIFDLEMEKNKLTLACIWRTYRPKPPVNDFSTIIIEFETIWWENIPKLESLMGKVIMCVLSILLIIGGL